MDHSCQPNAVAVFDGTELHVRNTVAIDTSQPMKVRIYIRSYNVQICFTCTCLIGCYILLRNMIVSK